MRRARRGDAPARRVARRRARRSTSRRRTPTRRRSSATCCSCARRARRPGAVEACAHDGRPAARGRARARLPRLPDGRARPRRRARAPRSTTSRRSVGAGAARRRRRCARELRGRRPLVGAHLPLSDATRRVLDTFARRAHDPGRDRRARGARRTSSSMTTEPGGPAARAAAGARGRARGPRRRPAACRASTSCRCSRRSTTSSARPRCMRALLADDVYAGSSPRAATGRR